MPACHNGDRKTGHVTECRGSAACRSRSFNFYLDELGKCHDGHAHHNDRGHASKLSRDVPWQLGLENLDKAEWKLDERLSLEKQREL